MRPAKSFLGAEAAGCHIFFESIRTGCIESWFYAPFSQTTDYLPCFLHTIAKALTLVAAGAGYAATILIDGLGRTERHRVGSGLKALHVRTEKIRGLRADKVS